MHSIFKKQKLWKGTQLSHCFADGLSDMHQRVNIMVQGDALYPQWDNSKITHRQETPESSAEFHKVCFQRRERPPFSGHLPLDSQRPHSSKDLNKTKNAYLNHKCCVVRKNSKRIHSGFQKFLLSSLKNGFWVMSKATSELAALDIGTMCDKKLVSGTMCDFYYSLNTWKPVLRTDFFFFFCILGISGK